MANATRTTQDTGRNSATTRDTAGTSGAGAARGKQAARADQSQRDAGQSGAAAGAAAPGDKERQVPIGRETQRQGAGATMRDQGQEQALGGAGSQARNTSPFSFMRRFGEEMDRLFEDFGFAPLGLDPTDLLIGAPRSAFAPNRSLGSGSGAQRGQATGRSPLMRQSPTAAVTSTRAAWLPQVEVLQRGDNLIVRADVPGLRPEDVRVEVDNGALTISGERSYQAEDENEGLYHSERVYGSFVRTIPLPQGVNPEDVQARVAEGVLEVTIPMPKESRSRRIEVR
ncbi:MAG TPA: Hsp20 family protein [Gemmatimonadaceae bacterium]